MERQELRATDGNCIPPNPYNRVAWRLWHQLRSLARRRLCQQLPSQLEFLLCLTQFFFAGAESIRAAGYPQSGISAARTSCDPCERHYPECANKLCVFDHEYKL